MDLMKLDPMARKMRTHIDAFYKALTDNDGFAARNHINEIVKYADYLSNDEEKVTGINEIYAGGVPVMKMQQTQTIHETTTNVLPGTIRTSRFGTINNRRMSNRTL